MLPYRIKRTLIWFKRMRHVQGFGIQSPSAFSFDRNVINDHTKYCIYSELKLNTPKSSKLIDKKARLLYRINRFLKADNFYFYPKKIELYANYIVAAYNTKIVEAKLYNYNIENVEKEKTNVYFLSILADYLNYYKSIRHKVGTNSILIIDGINRNNEAKQFWKAVIEDENVSFSYDLYYLGIVFFDKRPKQNYIINF